MQQPYRATDCALVFPKSKTAVVSDLHLTADESPSITISRLSQLIQTHSVETLVFNGDTFNEFPFNSQFLDWVDSLDQETIFIDGNHEEMVGGFVQRDSQVSYTFTEDNTSVLVTHGHTEIPVESYDLVVIGHLHPTKTEAGISKPCLLRTNTTPQLLIMPAFCFVDGHDLEFEACPLFTKEEFAKSATELIDVFSWPTADGYN